MGTATVAGGTQHGLSSLSHAERLAAQHALSKISGTPGGLRSGFAEFARNATSIGGSVKASVSSFVHGLGSDTFIGGARSLSAANIGNDTVLSGSAKAFDRGTESIGARGSNFALNSDTINVAGATAMNVRATEPGDTKSHTVTLGDKTTVTITGLSTHDISKITH